MDSRGLGTLHGNGVLECGFCAFCSACMRIPEYQYYSSLPILHIHLNLSSFNASDSQF
jgi:hypothetical protein